MENGSNNSIIRNVHPSNRNTRSNAFQLNSRLDDTQELTYTAGTISTGDLVDLYVYRIFFETNGNVTTIQLQTLSQQRPMAAAQFEVILASLAFFTP